MLFIGLLSGTSMDAIDCVLVEIRENGMDTKDYQQFAIPDKIQQRLKSVSESTTLKEYSELDFIMGNLFADAVNKILIDNKLSAEKITAIGSHGQTVLHQPDSACPNSLQLGNPNIIASRTGIKTVADFRRMDIAAGGQGAPLAPLLHNFIFQHEHDTRVVINIGGMANISVLYSRESGIKFIGYDTGPGNVLMDAWINLQDGNKYDENGMFAASGKVNKEFLDSMLKDNFFRLTPPKSTGKDYFNLQWLKTYLNIFSHKIQANDIQASLLELTAITIVNEIKKYPAKLVIFCGGGMHNPVLMQRISKLIPDMAIKTTDEFGINPDAIEALLFAWLAKCRLENLVPDLNPVTGSNLKQPLGAIY